LKARFDLQLEIPGDWTAIANGELASLDDSGPRHRYRFATTEPLPTYLLAFAVGKFEVANAERDGRTMRFLHRETDQEKVARNLDAIFGLHASALDWLESYTAIPHPFQKFDFVAIPAFQYGGMEHTGNIFYRARSLFLDETATQSQHLSRASLIAHETAHMWFGNLVTMKWFDDVWLKEVMANLMAAKIVHPSFPEVDHDLRFLLAHYPRAYEIDRTAGANPIRQELDNLNEAGSLYGAIIYQKAPIVMRQLELMIGEAAFREGIRDYLSAHRYGNAIWQDLVAALAAQTDEDLAAWSDVWVHTAGRPTVGVELAASEGTVSALTVTQQDPSGDGRLWSQQLSLYLGYASAPGRHIDGHLRTDRWDVADAVGLPVPDYVLANGVGIGYARFALDAASRDHLLAHLPRLEAPRQRAIAWLSLWDALLEGEVAPQPWIDLAHRALATESDELNIQRMLDDLEGAYWRYLTQAERSSLAPQLEALLWQRLEAAPQARLKSAFLATYRDVALSSQAIGRLRQLWSGKMTLDDLPLSENDLTALAQTLAIRRVDDAEAVLDQQAERIANPDRRARFDFVRPALSADPAIRDRFFDSLKDAESRGREPWVLEALEFLHHPLHAESSRHYLRPSLDLLEEIQRTGDIFFPLRWLVATLSGHSSPEAADIVREFLDQRPDLPPQLRGKLLQAADPLMRASKLDQN
ncbi:MAG: M1 family aminopeptidase, partial [Acidobacteriota bacterium]